MTCGRWQPVGPASQGPGRLTRRLASRLKLDGMLTEGYDQINFMDLIQEVIGAQGR